MAKQFFDESGEQSVVKATIIAKYFWAWAKVIIPTTKQHGDKIAYLNLFAGPGSPCPNLRVESSRRARLICSRGVAAAPASDSARQHRQ